MDYTAVVGVPAREVDSAYTRRNEAKDRRSLINVFKDWWDMLRRQELPSFWQPLPSMLWSIFFFAVLSVITVPLGSLIIWQTLENTELIVRYDSFPIDGSSAVNNTQRLQAIRNNPVNGSVLRSNMRVPKKMHSPVYLYYELKDYYQNHKRYVRSAAFNQIGEGDVSRSQLSVCEPYKVLDPETLPPEDNRTADERVINPCGLVAHSYFNDSFHLLTSVDEQGNDLELRLKVDGIATEWDRKYLYGDHNAQNFNEDNNTRGGGTIDGPLDEDEHFMVWMKVGSRPTIRKLYAIIEHDIPEGARLTFEINNRYNTYDYGGEKRLILSTANWTGGRNVFTGALFFAIGGASALACFAILLFDRHTDRRAGDLRALSWNKKKNS